jgi:hypothetical protein
LLSFGERWDDVMLHCKRRLCRKTAKVRSIEAREAGDDALDGRNDARLDVQDVVRWKERSEIEL